MFSFKTCVCLHIVEDCKFLAFYEKKTLYYSMLLRLINKNILIESPFHTEDFGPGFSHVDLRMHELRCYN